MPSKYADVYREAALVLKDSPKAAAALARRILADVLEDYGGYTEFNLSKRIEAFRADPTRPPELKENLRYLCEVGNFAAHTQKDLTSGAVIDVEPGEAEWTLDVVDGLFDYFVVGPERDKARREAIAAKVQQAGRNPIT